MKVLSQLISVATLPCEMHHSLLLNCMPYKQTLLQVINILNTQVDEDATDSVCHWTEVGAVWTPVLPVSVWMLKDQQLSVKHTHLWACMYLLTEMRLTWYDYYNVICISQGSAETHVRCGGNFYTGLVVGNLQYFLQWQNFENQLKFGKVIAKIRHQLFFRDML